MKPGGVALSNVLYNLSCTESVVLHWAMFLFLSDEGPMLETLDYTIRIGSTPTFLYFVLYNLSCTESVVLHWAMFCTTCLALNLLCPSYMKEVLHWACFASLRKRTEPLFCLSVTCV